MEVFIEDFNHSEANVIAEVCRTISWMSVRYNLPFKAITVVNQLNAVAAPYEVHPGPDNALTVVVNGRYLDNYDPVHLRWTCLARGLRSEQFNVDSCGITLDHVAAYASDMDKLSVMFMLACEVMADRLLDTRFAFVNQ